MSEDTSKTAHEPSKLPYEKPTLLRFGDVAELTKAVDEIGTRDATGGGNNKT